MDGHTEIIPCNQPDLYHDYDLNYCGEQVVTVSYKGVSKTCFEITLVGGECISCGGACTNRSFNDYSRFKYCDACLAMAPFYLGQSYKHKDSTQNEEIMETLDLKEVYYFSRNDYIKVSITRMSKSTGLPFLTNQTSIPIMVGGTVKTNGK